MLRGCIAVVVLLALAAGVAACGTAPDSPPNGTGNGAPVLDGATLLQQRCTVCHSLGRVLGATKDREAWLATIDAMIAKGARLTDEERSTLADYLVER